MLTLRTWLTLAIATLVPGCMSAAERKGDLASASGNKEEAVRHYEEALASFHMDFEDERIRGKLQRYGGTSKERALTELKTKQGTGPVAEYALSLLALETNDATIAERDRVLKADLLRAGDPSVATLTRMRVMIGNVPRWLVEVDSVLMDAVRREVAAIGSGGHTALLALLDMREQLRAAKVPASIDALVDPGLRALQPGQAPAAADMTVAIATLERAKKLGAPAPALAVAQQYVDASARPLIEAADAHLARHAYVAAFDTLTPVAATVSPTSEAAMKLAAIVRDGAAYHRAQFGQTTGAVQLVHGWLWTSFDSTQGPRDTVAELRDRLFPASARTVEVALTVTRAPECREVGAKLARTTTKPPDVRGAATLTCSFSYTTTADTGRHMYDYEREDKEVIGHEERLVDEGKGCLAFQISQGTCTPGDDTYEVYPVYKTTKSKQTDSLEYPIAVHKLDVVVQGSVAATFADGSQGTVPISVDSHQTEREYSYDLPPETIGGTPRHFEQKLPSGFTLEAAMIRADATVTATASKLTGMVEVRRAAAARARGSAAQQAGDAAGAAAGFVESILHVGVPEGDAAAWFQSTFSLTPQQTSAMGSIRLSKADAVAAITPDPYTVPSVVLSDDDRKPLDDAGASKDFDHMTVVEAEKRKVRLGSEHFRGQFSAMRYQLERAGDTPSAYAAGFEAKASIIESRIPRRYGPVFHDELGGRIALGKGDSGFSWMGEGYLRGFLGWRSHHIGVFGGVSGGYLRASVGDHAVNDWHLEPAARLAIRFYSTRVVLFEATGFVDLADKPRSDRLVLWVPIGPSSQLVVNYEETVLEGETLQMTGIGLGGGF